MHSLMITAKENIIVMTTVVFTLEDNIYVKLNYPNCPPGGLICGTFLNVAIVTAQPINSKDCRSEETQFFCLIFISSCKTFRNSSPGFNKGICL